MSGHSAYSAAGSDAQPAEPADALLILDDDRLSKLSLLNAPLIT